MPARTEIDYWLALQRAPGLGPQATRRALEELGEPRGLFESNPTVLEGLGLSRETLAYCRAPAWEPVEADRAWLEADSHHLITMDDSRYPALLAEIPDPPCLLFLRGDPAILDRPQLAIVGSRHATPAGEETAFAFAKSLAQAGMCITSGLALGIDGAAHRGALAGSGLTVAVAGCGLDLDYPSRHRGLAARIEETGAMISEFSPGMPPLAANFPRRNRIISGLSLGVLVVEAAQRSGSLITARMASEQGREVFAIPGSIHSPVARGCHGLIRQGAKLVESVQDILEELRGYSLDAGASVNQGPDDGGGAARDAEQTLDEDYRRLLQCLGYEAAPVDVLVERSGLTAEAVSSMLLILELRGFVGSGPGGTYTRIPGPRLD